MSEKDLEDGFVEEVDDKRVRIWHKAGEGGYWSTMSKLRHEGVIDECKMPFYCPICNLGMLADVDRKKYYAYKCCFKCSVYFVEGREDRWNGGWRPNKEDMGLYHEWRDRKTVYEIDPITLKKVEKTLDKG